MEQLQMGDDEGDRPDPNSTYRDREWLADAHDRYDEDVQAIADEAGASDDTIYRWLRRFGIGGYADRGKHDESAGGGDLPWSVRNDRSGHFQPTFEDGEFIQALEGTDGLSTGEVADDVGCKQETALKRLKSLRDEGRVTSRKVGRCLLWRAAE